MRLFIAADLPGFIKDSLAAAAAGLGLPGIRIVNRENMHFTLAFLGNADEGMLDGIRAAIDRTEMQRFSIEVKGMRHFGNPGAVYSFAGLGADGLARAAASLRSELGKSMIRFDNREFVPHVTVARIKRRIDDQVLQRAMLNFEGTVFGSFSFEGISLFSSMLGSLGPKYSRLYERKV